jgi:hypothetical protein
MWTPHKLHHRLVVLKDRSKSPYLRNELFSWTLVGSQGVKVRVEMRLLKAGALRVSTRRFPTSRIWLPWQVSMCPAYQGAFCL